MVSVHGGTALPWHRHSSEMGSRPARPELGASPANLGHTPCALWEPGTVVAQIASSDGWAAAPTRGL